MKNKKKLIAPIVLVSILLLLSVGAFVFSMMKGKLNDGSKDEEVHHAKEYQLFWNVDGAAYMADSTNGITTREKDGAFFSVCFATGGKQETYKVTDMRLMNKIDGSDIMGLEIDEKGTITGMLTLEEIGATVVGEQFYVASLEDKKVTLNSSTNFNGVEEVLKVTKKTSVFDVSGMSEYVGQDTSLVEGDRVLAVKNAAGDVTDIFAIQRSDRYGSEQSYCEHCQQMVYWRSWTNEIRLPFSDGHWRLDVDVKIGRQTNITADNTVVLDLNGHTAEAPVDNRLYANYEERSNLVIMDTSKEQTGRLVASGNVPSGGIVWVRYGTFTMYGGTLDGSKINSNSTGATIKTEKYTETYIYDGTIIGGTSTTGLKEDLSGVTGGSGANLHILGTLTMYDGVIRDGKAVSYYEKNTDKYRNGIGGNLTLGATGVFNFYGGKIENGQSDCGGANVYLSGGSVLNMTGGTISGGKLNSTQKKNGGNVWVSVNSTMNMSGGVIENGKTYSAGGNMALYGTMNMSGGSIKGGTVLKDGKRNDTSRSHNIYFQKGLLNMSGGAIEGYVQVVKNTETPVVVKLSGTAQIYGGDSNLYLPADVTINVDNLKKGANIYVNALGFFSTETDAGNEQYVHSDYVETDIVYAEKKLYAGQQHCVCGGWHFDADGKRVDGHYGSCKGEQLLWKPWNKTNVLPREEGNWYLTSDITLSQQMNIVKGAIVYVDLNGKLVTGCENKRIFSQHLGDNTLVLLDTSDTRSGKLVASGTANMQGNCNWIANNSKCEIYAGTYDASTVISKHNGTAIHLSKGCELSMYSGTIKGGYAIKADTAKKKTEWRALAGSVYVDGKFTMWDSVIQGGKAFFTGGNLYVTSNGEFYMHSGKIIGGVAEGGSAEDVANKLTAGGGGNICATGGKVEIQGGEIRDGSSVKNGGNIYLSGAVKFVLRDGLITGGVSGESGGNIAVMSSFVMAGGLIEKGKAKTERTNNVFINTSNDKYTFSMTGGTVKGYMAIGSNTKMVLNFEGTPKVYGGSVNLYLPTNMKIHVGTLKDGANIYVNSTGFFTAETAQGNEQYIHSDYLYTDVLYVENKLYAGQQHCICGEWHFDAEGQRVDGHYGTCTGQQILWKPWNQTGALPKETGNWYLTSNVALSQQMNVVAGAKINLDLNGKQIVGAENKRIYSQHLGDSILVLLDTSDERSGKLIASGNENMQGNCNWIANNSKCEIYAGTYDASTVISKHNGTAIYLSKGCELSMYSGTIKGGYAIKADSATKVSEWRALAGSVYVDGKFSMWDTIIEGGKAVFTGGNIYVTANGAFYMHSGKILGGVAEGGNAQDLADKLTSGGGGNICAKGGIVEILGGEVRDGQSAKNGGNIYLAGDVIFTLKDGLITGGVSGESGGNIAIMSSFTMIGGTIENGKANTERTNNVFINTSNSEYMFSMTGGTVKGYMTIGSSNKMVMNFGGTAVVFDEEAKQNLYLDKEQLMNLTGFAEGAKISVTKKGYGNTTGVDGIISTATANETDLQYVFADDTKTEVKVTDNKELTLFREGVVIVTWTDWTDDKTLPTTAGKYKLTTNVNLDAQWNVPADTSIVLNLNGKTIKGAKGKRICSLQENSKLEIMDEKTTAGKLVMNIDEENTYSFQGGVVWLSGSGSEFILNGGTLDATDLHTTNSGAAVYVSGGTTFTMSGGKILGGTVYYDSANSKARNGGSVYVAGNGSFTMTGGTISGGEAGDSTNVSDGGNVYIAGNGRFAMSGGTIERGCATRYGGNVYISSGVAFAVTGGMLDGGLTDGNNAEMGGNIYVAAGGSVTMSGGTIKAGRATTYGGNVYLAKKSGTKIASFAMTGGTMTGGKTTWDTTKENNNNVNVAGEGGGNVYLGEGATFTMSKDKTVDSAVSPIVSGGESAEGGGNILAVGSGATITITDAIVTGGVAKTGQGGNISVRSYATLVMNGSESAITDGKVEANSGGNVGVITANLNLTGGTITGGTSTNTNTNGNVFVNNNNTANKDLFITIKGCTIGTPEVVGVALTKITGTTVDTDKEY